ncbi:MAG TPA: nuclear transport factor 2 family protein [Solirubrobacteraceae bacterium]|nr:nuclear transport factor 2 family protein [Solirubrobacteraceae bacterium]
MASENVELARLLFAAWERGDYSSAEGVHPDVEYVIADGPSPGTWKGLDGLVEGWRDFLSAWENFRGQAEEYRELDDQRVLVLTTFTGRGKKSGVELGHMRAKGAVVCHIHDGRVTRQVLYLDRQRALADLGVAPEARSPSS